MSILGFGVQSMFLDSPPGARFFKCGENFLRFVDGDRSCSVTVYDPLFPQSEHLFFGEVLELDVQLFDYFLDRSARGVVALPQFHGELVNANAGLRACLRIGYSEQV
jgi:hypothetical protein